LRPAPAPVDDISFDDLLLAAADVPPSTLFRSKLADMTPADWTRLCLLGAQGASRKVREVPDFFCLAALAALRFGPAIVGRVAEALRPVWDRSDPEEFERILSAKLAKAGFDSHVPPEPGEIGVLVIVWDLEAPRTSRDGFDDRPFLLLARGQVSGYAEALTWLKDRGVFDEVLDEL